MHLKFKWLQFMQELSVNKILSNLIINNYILFRYIYKSSTKSCFLLKFIKTCILPVSSLEKYMQVYNKYEIHDHVKNPNVLIQQRLNIHYFCFHHIFI